MSHADMTREQLVEVLLSLDRPVPRYTSYPPANHFGPLDPSVAGQALERVGTEDDLSLYVHLPFCRRKCAYCGCFSLVPRDPAQAASYVDQVAAEAGMVQRVLGRRQRVVQVQWGGGTPNYLEPALMERLFNGVASSFHVDDNAELGVELDPTFLNQEQVRALKSLGFNRVSLGVQDLDQGVQRLIGRGQSEEVTVRAYRMCREAGFKSVHMDLVYGLPGQTRASLEETLSKVVDLGPDRLSLFGFAYLPDLRPNQASIPADKVPDARLRAELYALAVDVLTSAGYVRVGMDHFARPWDELALARDQGRLHRNFQGYTVQPAGHLVGLGVSAIGDVSGVYCQNTKDLEAYGSRVESGVLPVERGFACSGEDLVRKRVIESIMCNGRVDFQEVEEMLRPGEPFRDHFSSELEALSELVEQGVAVLGSGELSVAPHAWPLARLVAAVFDQYLAGGGRYSRTV